MTSHTKHRLLISLLTLCSAGATSGTFASDSAAIDFRYAPPDWQTSICLPDDWQKTLVGKSGAMLYDFPGKHSGFKTRIQFTIADDLTWTRQELVSPRVPIVRTFFKSGDLEMSQEAFALPPSPNQKTIGTTPPPFRLDVLLVRIHYRPTGN